MTDPNEFESVLPDHAPEASRRLGSLVLLALAAAALAAGMYRYHPFFADDSFISLRYSQRLLDGHGLTWTDGVRVEGYSNLLWVLGVAAVGLTGMDLVTAARLLGFLGVLAAIAALIWWWRPAGRSPWPALVATSLSVAICGPATVWAVGGLEQPLVFATVTWGTVLLLRQLTRDEPDTRQLVLAGVAYGLLCLTRPDGAVVPVIAVGVLFLASWKRPRRWAPAMTLAAIPAACVVGQQIFRLVYYRDWVPNTSYAKVATNLDRVKEGAEYMWVAHLTLLALSIPALVAIGFAVFRPSALTPGARLRIAFLTLAWIGWSCYVTVIGGDIFPAFRHVFPALTMAALLALEGWQALVDLDRPRSLVGRVAFVAFAGACWLALVVHFIGIRLTDHRTQVAAGIVAVVVSLPVAKVVASRFAIAPWHIWGAIVVSLACTATATEIHPAFIRAVDERWEWDCEKIADTLRDGLADRAPLLAVDPAGCLPYFSELPSIDMLGLNDRYLAHHRPDDLGTGAIGHELGNGAYVLRRQPDLVIMCGPNGSSTGCFRSGEEMLESDTFRRDYRLERVISEPDDYETLVWVRVPGRVGVDRADDRVTIPGLLLADHRGDGDARLADGRIVTVLAAGGATEFTDLDLDAGTWTIDVAATGEVTATVDGRGVTSLDPTTVRLDDDGTVDVRLDAAGDAVVTAVTLRRESP